MPEWQAGTVDRGVSVRYKGEKRPLTVLGNAVHMASLGQSEEKRDPEGAAIELGGYGGKVRTAWVDGPVSRTAGDLQEVSTRLYPRCPKCRSRTRGVEIRECYSCGSEFCEGCQTNDWHGPLCPACARHCLTGSGALTDRWDALVTKPTELTEKSTVQFQVEPAQGRSVVASGRL
jgi:hypothetical protein